jgi:hypothetical protein
MLRDLMQSLDRFFTRLRNRADPEATSKAALENLSAEIAWCDLHVTNVNVVMRLLTSITVEAHKAEARALIATCGNFTCKQFAINLDPSFAKVCADTLLAAAREHLENGSEREHATWASTMLAHAMDWYHRAGALTPSLAEEIEGWLRKMELARA